MSEFLNILTYGFMQRAILAGLLIAMAAGLMGTFAMIRKGAFFGDAIAHSSLAGVALGVFFQVSPVMSAAVYAIAASIALPAIQRRSQLSLDNILGILLPVSMGLSVIIFSLLPGYQPELLGFLFGNILAVTASDLYFLVGITLAISLLLSLYLNKLLQTSIDPQYAQITGINTKLMDTIYHLLLALSIVAGVKLVGVILVNALLVIPSSIAAQYAKSMKELLILTPLVSVAITLIGIIISALIDTPSGATIAILGGLIFLSSIAYQGTGSKAKD